MRFLRLRIANYRGVIASEVDFGSSGVTLVQGPNEAGKTSLGEAIGLLFEYVDSSKHRNIEAIRPVHRDEGPEIEVQVESGPYVFTYFKRFYKKPQTTLTITLPKPENYTGREAHERAEAILLETIDIDLWKALNIQQGDAIQQPTLTKQKSLSAALDSAAGGRPADPGEEGLFDRIRDEYILYFTERGAEKRGLQEARKRQEEAKAEVAGLEQQIRDLEQDIEGAAILQLELGRLKKQEQEQVQAVDVHLASLEKISVMENALNEVKLKLESAQKSEQVAYRDKDARQLLIDNVDKITETHRELLESLSMSLPTLNQAENEFKKEGAFSIAADKESKKADVLAILRRDDFDYYNNKLHLEQLTERKERIDQARKDAIQAEDVLERNKATPQILEAISQAEKELLTAKAKLEMGAPHISLDSLAEFHLIIDDVPTTLNKGENRSLLIADTIRLTIPRKLDIEVTTGASLEGLQKQVTEAQHALENACETAGVTDPNKAREALDDRLKALQQVDNKEQTETENLRDLTYEDLGEKVSHLQQSVPTYLAERQKKPVICPDLDSAKKERANADVNQQRAKREAETARDVLDATRNVRDGLKVKYENERVRLDLLAQDLKQAQDNLDRARKSNPDDTLDTNLTEAIRTVGTEEANSFLTEESLQAENPDRVRTLYETASDSLKTTRNRQNTAQTELTEVQTRLKIQGEEGLHEKIRAVQIRLERIGHENHALFRQTAVAKYLFESIQEERDRARHAYVSPLKENIENLSRLVFDDTFEVEISDELQIESRTLNGVRIPFDSLSGGTKEQLSLIFRIACSIMVAKDRGAPLILDDALGYTDPDRLRLMGTVLAKAAKECQVIIFTCVPDRYSNIGEATIVSLR